MEKMPSPLFFDTFLIAYGSIPLWNYHKKRIEKTEEVLEVKLVKPIDKIIDEILFVAPKDSFVRCRITFYQNGRFVDYDITMTPLKDDEVFPKKPISLVFFPDPKAKNSLNNFKMYSKLIYETATEYAHIHEVPQVLMSNEANEVIETNTANIFWMLNQKIYTPFREEGAVAGVFQTFIEENMDINFGRISREELMEVDEIFVTNAVRGIMLVNNIEGKEKSTIQSQKIQNTISKLPIFDFR